MKNSTKLLIAGIVVGVIAAMGYTNIVEFGGILDWTGEVEK